MIGTFRRPVVGRDRDLATVEDFLGGIEEGFGLLSIEGEAGIGKTTVWETAIDRTRTSSLTARPRETESALSFVGLSDLLEGADDSV
ncbi:MAG TPA: hypothetical protein VJQ79_09690, partial [Acidimicrobiia bacterium]|nr:hypothetical protein [Acidimicrobiia bacterium]